ncbi:hypothetical protein L6F55_004317 [Salmonella enterica]|nr:hypothetical protein [Salmonella enterica]EJI4314102.1 hypothetical protein [Salmonella enterica]ELI3160635.1 hypothetical protein [Salmonella enterica]
MMHKPSGRHVVQPVNTLVDVRQMNTGHEASPLRVTNGAKVIHIRRLKSDPGGNLLS